MAAPCTQLKTQIHEFQCKPLPRSTFTHIYIIYAFTYITKEGKIAFSYQILMASLLYDANDKWPRLPGLAPCCTYRHMENATAVLTHFFLQWC